MHLHYVLGTPKSLSILSGRPSISSILVQCSQSIEICERAFDIYFESRVSFGKLPFDSPLTRLL